MDHVFLFQVITFAVLMGLSGFFSSSETALFSLNNVQLERMRVQEHPRIGLIERMLAEPRRLIITILIGNELVNVAASVISASIVISMLGADKKWVNLFVMVPILLLVGEITPKTLAIKNNVAFAGFQCRPISAFSRLVTPLRWLVRLIADGCITVLVGKERSRGNLITADMLRTLAHEAVGEGVLDRFEAGLIDRIFDFGDKTVADIMTPRSDIVYLPARAGRHEMIREFRRTWQTRIPVFDGNRDNIVGILHARDLLRADVASDVKDTGLMEELLREAYFVPGTKQAVELFHTFRTRRMSIALVVDEYGGVIGLVTMEDLLECIFGRIRSPSEQRREAQMDLMDDGRTALDGSVRVADFNRVTGHALPTEFAETMAGLMLHEHGELPVEGTSLVLGELRFDVVEVAENRIKRLLCSGVEVKASDEGENAREQPPASADTANDPDALGVTHANVAEKE